MSPAPQHPPGHEELLQTQDPPTQSCPEVQATQDAPPVPHWLSVGGVTQVVALAQQPLPQEPEVHWQLPDTQSWVEVQTTQLTPPVPQ